VRDRAVQAHRHDGVEAVVQHRSRMHGPFAQPPQRAAAFQRPHRRRGQLRKHLALHGVGPAGPVFIMHRVPTRAPSARHSGQPA
jgi:hypothetical protein